MLYNLRTALAKHRFGRQIAAIHRTPPIGLRPDGCSIVTMVSHADLGMYLLAIKSFYRRVGFGKIVVLDDGSLTAADRTLLTHHLVAPEFVLHTQVARGTLPRDIMWERLAYILARAQDDYTIQLDSDTVSTAALPEVKDCIAHGRPFILGTPEGQALVPALAAAAAAKADGSQHVQTLCEAAFADMPGAETMRYVRGSAGFFGLPKGSVSLPGTEAMVSALAALVGPRFMEWGSEQVACNLLVANAPGAAVLSHPAHASFTPELATGRSAFLHFIGSHRFHNGEYARQGRRFLSGAA